MTCPVKQYINFLNVCITWLKKKRKNRKELQEARFRLSERKELFKICNIPGEFTAIFIGTLSLGQYYRGRKYVYVGRRQSYILFTEGERLFKMA